MAMAPVILLAIVLSPWVGKNVTKGGPRGLSTVAFLGFALVLWMRSHFTVQSDMATILIPTVLKGCDCLLLHSLERHHLVWPDSRQDPVGIRLEQFCRITAGAMGTSVVTTIWDDRATLHHVHLVEKISVTDLPPWKLWGH